MTGDRVSMRISGVVREVFLKEQLERPAQGRRRPFPNRPHLRVRLSASFGNENRIPVRPVVLAARTLGDLAASLSLEQVDTFPVTVPENRARGGLTRIVVAQEPAHPFANGVPNEFAHWPR